MHIKRDEIRDVLVPVIMYEMGGGNRSFICIVMNPSLHEWRKGKSRDVSIYPISKGIYPDLALGLRMMYRPYADNESL